MAQIKYMGSSDVRVIPAGTDWNSLLAVPLDKTLVFDSSNGWVVDTDELGLPADVVERLKAEPEFQDVTGLAHRPVNVHQSMFLGLSDPEPEAEVAVEVATPAEAPAARRSGRGDSTPDA